MIATFKGRRYDFRIFSEENGRVCEFYIKAKHRRSRRFSCINNLNTILSALLPESKLENLSWKYEESTWVVSKKEAERFSKRAFNFLFDAKFRTYLESKLDEDRSYGEWENREELSDKIN